MSTTELNPRRTDREASWLAFDAYVFDIDGTLLNSLDLVHYRAFQKALFEVYGCTRDVSEVPVQGNTDIGILRATTRLCGIDDDAFERRLPEALAVMRRGAHANAIDFRLEVCPAIPRTLETLRLRGKLLGIATGNLAEIGWSKLSAAQLKHYFKFGSFSDQSPNSPCPDAASPCPASAAVSRRGYFHEQRSEIFANALAEARRQLGPEAQVCFVGDTPADVSAAKANACPIIAVGTGIYSHDQLSNLAPDFCLSCCSDLFTA
jgi:phosphoglycolate phosphatase-like HAD superfamily hydrolase